MSFSNVFFTSGTLELKQSIQKYQFLISNSKHYFPEFKKFEYFHKNEFYEMFIMDNLEEKQLMSKYLIRMINNYH